MEKRIDMAKRAYPLISAPSVEENLRLRVDRIVKEKCGFFQLFYPNVLLFK